MFLRILVILIFAKCALVRAQNDQLVLVRRQNKLEDTLQCVSTEAQKAVVWDTPIEEKYARNITTTFPNTKVKEVWTFLKGRVNSFEGVYGPVTDSRWESFPTVFTGGTLTFKILRWMYVYGTFQIPISVRTEGEANIYICSGIGIGMGDPSQSVCYWIILGGWGGTKSVLRKCKKGEIPKDDTVPLKNCGTSLGENVNNILNVTNFVHFVIQFDSISQTISLVVLGENKPFLSYSDKDYDTHAIFNSVWVKSQPNSAFWKIHDYDYYTVAHGRDERIAISFSSTYCISMYVAVCKECKLLIRWVTQNFGNVSIGEYSYNKNVIWQRIFFLSKKYTEPGGYVAYYLRVTVINPLGVPSSVALHNLQFSSNCFSNEFKYSTLNLQAGDLKNATCKYLVNEGQITTRPVTDVTKLDLSCPLGTIGPTCVNCSYLANQCRYSQICQHQNNDEICYCSAGYTNEQCTNHCPVNTYGINCQYECGRCKNVMCDLSTIDYEITNCNMKRSQVTGVGFNSSSTEIYVYWEQPHQTNGSSLHYDVHIQHLWYKQCNNTRNKSIEFTKSVKGNNVLFKGLPRYSLYYVSISTSNNDSVHYLRADTNASDILMAEGYNISTTATARELIIELATSEAYCSNTIKISSNGTYGKWKISDLKPFTEYRVYSRVNNSFQKSLQLPVISFKTQPDVPNPVRNFEHYGMSKQYFHFRFDTPYPPTGDIEIYNLNVSIWKQNKYTFSKNIRKKYSAPCKIWYWMQCFTISLIKPDSYYKIQLAAKNKNILEWSKNANLTVHTITGRPDPPKNFIVTWDEANNQVLQWEHPNKMNGLLSTFSIDLGATHVTYSPPKYNLTYSYKINYKPETDAIRGYLSPVAVEVAIRCVNIDNKTSDVETIFAYYPPPIPEFADSPTFNMTNQTVSVDIPKILKQGENSSLYIIVATVKQVEDPKPSKSEIKLIKDWINPPPEFTSWIAKEYTLTPENEPIHAVIGNGETTFSTRTDENITNWATQSGNINKIYVVALNEKGEFSRLNVYILEITSTNDESKRYFLLLLLIIPLMLLIYCGRKYNTTYTRNSEGPTAVELQTFPIHAKRVNSLYDLEVCAKESIANVELDKQHELLLKGEQNSKEYEEVLEGSVKRQAVT